MKKKRQHQTGPRHSLQRTPEQIFGRQLRLSLCMIVRNESQYLAGCLQDIRPVVDEIIVVDTGSEDNTRDIARAAGAQVFEFPWCDDFAAARNVSIEHATGDYILWLDADDRLDAAEVEKIRQLKNLLPLGKNAGYFFTVRSDPKDGQGWAFLQVRIFPNIPAGRFELPIHEQVSYNLLKAGIQLCKADITIRHIGNPDNTTILKKAERNLRIIEKYLAQHPDDPLMHYQAARTKSAMYRQKESLEHMRLVLENPEIRQHNRRIYLEGSILMGRYYKELGQYHSAVEHYAALLQEYPDLDLIHFYYGECLMDVERYQEARAELEKTMGKSFAVDFFPLKLELMKFQQYFLMGKAYQKTQDPGQAESMYQQALKMQPKHPAVLEALGTLYLEQKQYAAARDLLEQAAAQNTKSDRVYSNLGLAYRRLGRKAEAEAAWAKALEIQPNRVEALIHAGYLYLEQSEYAKAAEFLERAAQLDTQAIDIHLALSEIYFQQHQLELVLRECEKLLGLSGVETGNTFEGLEDLAALYGRIGDWLLDQGQSANAFRAYSVAFLIYPLASVFEKMFQRAINQGQADLCLKNIQSSLLQHAQDPKAVAALKTMLAQVQNQLCAAA